MDASRLHGEGYRKLWARLRFAGVRASPRRVRRVMRENGLLAPHRVLRTEAKLHDGRIVTDKVNEMWGTDMTVNIAPRLEPFAESGLRTLSWIVRAECSFAKRNNSVIRGTNTLQDVYA